MLRADIPVQRVTDVVDHSRAACVSRFWSVPRQDQVSVLQVVARDPIPILVVDHTRRKLKILSEGSARSSSHATIASG